ncbi:MAG: helix-turn-helix domain-containing protein [Nannocystaceae bacterium]
MGESCERRRDQILAAAERLLGHYGPGKTTVAEIAREAGIGVGTVYLEFSSKDSILVALSEERHDEILAAMSRASEVRGPAAERLGKLFLARTDGYLALADAGAHAVDLIHCHACAALHDVRAAFHQRTHGLIEGLIREAARNREFQSVDPSRSAGAVLEAFAAFAPPWLYQRPRASVHAELVAVTELVVLGLARRR